jgi:UDPglucose 6-dehydrogenase
MAKYAVNSMLAARISLMNELAGMCEAYGANITEVRECLSADNRIGAQYLFPGLGFGGSCLPKDVIACAHLAKAAGLPSPILDAITWVNEARVHQFIQRILDYYKAGIRGKKIAVWGASFKPRTDDLRGGPALRVIDALLDAGARVAVYDPEAGPNLRTLYGDRITVATKCYTVLEGADGLVVATEWNEFRRPDYERMAALMVDRVIFDGRNLYTAKALREYGFRYFSIGQREG